MVAPAGFGQGNGTVAPNGEGEGVEAGFEAAVFRGLRVASTSAEFDFAALVGPL